MLELVVKLFFNLGKLWGCESCEVDWKGAVSACLCVFERGLLTSLSFWGSHFVLFWWEVVAVELLVRDALEHWSLKF